MSGLNKLMAKVEGVDEDEWREPVAEPATVTLEWMGRQWTGPLRIMSADEMLDRDQIVARMVGDTSIAAFPNYSFWRALATIRVMWPSIPAWLDYYISKMPQAAIGLVREVDAYEAKFCIEALGQSGEDPTSPGFSIRASYAASAPGTLVPER